MQQILIVGPSWVGDMIMAQSLFITLKQMQPSCEIDVIAPEWSVPILERIPEIRKRITLPISHGQVKLKVRRNFAKQLAAVGYQRAIILPNSWKSALIPFWAKIPLRTGWLGEFRFGLLNDLRHSVTKYPKMVQRYVALAYAKNELLPNEIPSPKLINDKVNIAKLTAKFNLQFDKPILALCPGAAYGAAKRWPEEYYAEVANTKIQQGWQIWLFGSNQDQPVISSIQTKINGESINFAGNINLFETIDLFSLVTSVVCNDSGLMHMAASLDKPVLAIYGSTSPVFTPPLNSQAKIFNKQLACSPCFKRECKYKHYNCLRNIKPEEILAELN